MAKLIYTEKANDGHNIHYIAGNVSFVNAGTGEYEGKVMNIGMTLETFNPVTREREKKLLTVSFWNSNENKLADRIRNAKVQAGAFLLVKCGELRDAGINEDGVQKLNAYGFRFQYNEALRLSEKNTLICGPIRRINEVANGITAFIPVKTRSGDSVWYSVNFFNREVNGKVYKIGERAAKYGLANGTNVCAICGPVEVVEGEDKTFHNLHVYDFCVGYCAEPKEGA